MSDIPPNAPPDGPPSPSRRVLGPVNGTQPTSDAFDASQARDQQPGVLDASQNAPPVVPPNNPEPPTPDPTTAPLVDASAAPPAPVAPSDPTTASNVAGAASNASLVPDENCPTPIPVVIAARQAKTRQQRKEREGMKPGNRGRFPGIQGEVLDEYADEYLAIDRDAPGKNGRLAVFWHKVMSAYWSTFSIKDARHTMGPRNSLYTDGAMQHLTNESIKTHFRWVDKTPRARKGNPIARAMRKYISKGPAPRKQPAWRVHASTVSDRVRDEGRQRTTDPKFALANRNDVAREIFEELDSEEQQRLRESAEDQHNQKLEKYRLSLSDTPSTDPEDQREATARLSIILQPLLSLLSAHTGLPNFSVIAGAPPADSGGSYRLIGVHYGPKTRTGQTFAQHNSDAYRDLVLGSFANFLASTTDATMHDAPPVAHGAERQFRVTLLDPYEREREDNAEQMARDTVKEKRKTKKGKKRSSRSDESLGEGAGSSPPPADENQRPAPRPKKRQRTTGASSSHASSSHASSSHASSSHASSSHASSSHASSSHASSSHASSSASSSSPAISSEPEPELENRFTLQEPTPLLPYVPPVNEFFHPAWQDGSPLDPSLLAIPPMPSNPHEPIPSFPDMETMMARAPVPGFDFDLDINMDLSNPVAHGPQEDALRLAVAQHGPSEPLADNGASVVAATSITQNQVDGQPCVSETTHGSGSSEEREREPSGTMPEDGLLPPSSPPPPPSPLSMRAPLPLSLDAQPAQGQPTSSPPPSPSLSLLLLSSLPPSSLPPSSPPPPSSRPPSPLPARSELPPVSLSGAPAWLQRHYTRLRDAAVDEEHRAAFNAMLDDWVRLECAIEAENTVITRTRYPTDTRPYAVTYWIRCGRQRDVQPHRSPDYAAELYAWWVDVNPAWRTTANGRLVRRGTGDWSEMVLPGVNGLLNVIAGVVALHGLVESSEWVDFLEDVAWVIRGVLGSMEQGGLALPAPAAQQKPVKASKSKKKKSK
ncbi:hypothetical protein PsYK624_146960 [Phanerochaete sordida]|uniref:Uncharacterized protein n=1 Tax=Phanerochaete sordida TaxID=48140 RepID=A0A9P3GSA0_9APHY|nr:hypothetical protein PsYK624_146960 [Phanerochaete sordida]